VIEKLKNGEFIAKTEQPEMFMAVLTLPRHMFSTAP